MKDKYIEECKIIQQNCTYTAETHHQMAAIEKRKKLWLEVIPAAIAAITSALVAAGIAKEDLLILTVIAAVMTAITSIVNPGKAYEAQLSAGKNFTTLKHDARYLHTTQVHRVPDESFAILVDRLHEKYNELVKSSPTTSKLAFECSRKIVQDGIHEPDKDQQGKVL